MNLKVKPLQQPLERRRHQRVDVSLLGRYMLEDKREYPCQTTNVSPGGAALIAPVRGQIGERVVAYFEHIGRIEGNVARHTDHGFALAFNVPLVKRDKIANQLTWLVNRDSLGMAEDRQHERIIPNLKHTILKVENDREHVVRLIDISLSGAGVATTLNVPLGTRVMLGNTPGEVVRIFEGGLGVNFDETIALERFDENIKL
jgi:PilZ domain-containing protein